MSISFSRVWRGAVLAAWLAVAAALALNLYWLSPELSISRADLNDNVLHYRLAGRMAEAIERGENPFDHWVSEWTLGYPVPRTYQPLGSFSLAALYLALGKSVSLLTLFVWARFLLLVFFPLSVYWAARLLEFDRLRAAAAAIAAPLIATNGLYGLEFGSYIWRGSGLYTQLWAMHLFVLTLGFGYRAFSRARGRTLAGILLALTFLGHFVYGYMAALSLLLMAALHPKQDAWPARAARLAWIAAVSVLLTASFLLPLWIDKPFINRSRWEEAWKWNSFGVWEVLGQLLRGGLLDFGRLPVLTLLAAGGLAVWALARWGKNAARRFNVGDTPAASLNFVAAGVALWLFLYCGRESWGVLFSVLGAGEDVPLHRLIGGVQVFALLLCGFGLGSVWHWFRWKSPSKAALGAVAATLLLLSPALYERNAFISQGAQWGAENLAAHAAQGDDAKQALAEVQARPGRTFAGLAGDWGREFRLGSVPMFGLLATHGEPALGMLYHAMALPADITVRFNEWRPDHYRLFNVSALLADASRQAAGFLAPAGRHGRFQVYHADGGGYFDLVGAPYSALADRNNFYDLTDPWLQSDWVDKRLHIRLDFEPDALPELPRLESTAALPALWPARGLGEVRGESRSGEVYSAQVRVDQPGYLLFKMSYHPNWRVLVNGEPRATVILTPGMVGVALTPGEYGVECRYQPEVWRTTLLFAGWIGGLVLLAGERRGWAAALEQRAIAWGAAGWRAVPGGWRRRFAVAAGLLAVALPVCVPLATSRLLLGHDALEYLPRLVEFHENIRHGILLPRWAPDLSQGFGQPFFVFNPPLVYYLAEIWLFSGVDPLTALNLTCALLIVGSAAAMFLLGRFWFGAWGGWLAAAAYVYAPYFHVDLYVRHALAEFAAFPFYPLSFYGFARFAGGRDARFLLLGSAAYAAVIAAHHPAAFLFSPILLSFVVFLAVQNRSWKTLPAQCAGLALGLGLGAAVWAPGLFERQFVKLDRLLDGYLQYTNHFVYLQQFFATNWGYGLSVAGYDDGMSFSLGWGHLLVAAFGWIAVTRWMSRRERRGRRRLLGFFSAWCILLGVSMLAGSEWFWAALPLMKYIEFPWRMLAPACFCLAAVCAAAGPVISKWNSFRGPAMAAALALLILPNLAHIAPPGYQTVDLRQWTPQQLTLRGISVTTRNEYEPIGAHSPGYRAEPARILAGSAQGELHRLTPTYWSGEIAAGAGTTLEISCFFFPGWQARIDGRPAPIDASPDNGLIRLSFPEGRHHLELFFSRTPLRAFAELISLASAMVLAAFWWRAKRKSRAASGGEPPPAAA